MLRFSLFASVAVGLGLATGCTGGRGGQENALQYEQPNANRRPSPPLAVSLDGKSVEGTLALSAVVTVTGRLPGPVVLRLDLPEGTTLLEGLAYDELGVLVPGSRIERTFRIEGGAAKVAVDAVGEAAGAHAEGVYPDTRVRSGDLGVKPVAIPPTRIHGVTVDQSIPLN